MTAYKKGDIVLVNFSPKRYDEEVGKVRPAIIISASILNGILDLIAVIPLTTNLIDDALPLRVRISKREGLEYESDAMIENIRAVSKERILKKVSSLKSNEYELIKEGLLSLLDLN